jgi:hypothetical protein
MPTPSDPRLAVLHGLRLKGVAPATAVAEAIGQSGDEVTAVLADLQDAGFTAHREGSFGGWTITTEGRAEHARLMADEIDESGVRHAVQAAYERFLVLNPELLATCTRWQVRDATAPGGGTVNDHSDAGYDAAVSAELAGLHDQVLPILAELEALLPRFGRYRPALTTALEAVQAGDGDMFTKPIVASYHTLWFELHEDLLATLGLDRAAEPHGPTGAMA